jgi:drug/metabolite transporter (DMT)-like permease
MFWFALQVIFKALCIIFTGLLSQWILNRRLNRQQWCAMLLLLVGFLLALQDENDMHAVQTGVPHTLQPRSRPSTHSSTPLLQRLRVMLVPSWVSRLADRFLSSPSDRAAAQAAMSTSTLRGVAATVAGSLCFAVQVGWFVVAKQVD